MSAVQVFDALHDAGLSVSLAPGGGLAVSPGSRLTPDLRELVKANKSALLDWLQAANDPASHAGVLENLIKPAMAQAENNPAGAVPHALESAAPELPTDPDAWRELAQAYYRHHFSCVVCIAAGRGSRYGPRCGAGAALWTSYQDSGINKTRLRM